MNDDDDDLVRQIRVGDERAAAFFVSLYAQQLTAYARAIAPDLSDTDRQFVCDLAVETAVRRIDRYRPELGTLARWLRPFVRHAAQDWRRRTLELEPLPATDIATAENIDETDPHRHEALQRVTNAIKRLSDTDQLIIALRDREQLTYREIANRLGVEEAASRQRHRRAVNRLALLVHADETVKALLRNERTSEPPRGTA